MGSVTWCRPGLLSSALLVASFLGGCGGGATNRGAARPERDDALVLAHRLPAGADRCSVARPGLVSHLRRPLVGRAARGAHAEALAWEHGAPIVAAASASRTYSTGERVWVGLLRISSSPEEARRWLAEDAPVRVAWRGEPSFCDGSSCLRASFVDRRTIRLEQGTWPSSTRPGAERRCTTLASVLPDAIEISVEGPRAAMTDLLAVAPRRVETLVFARRAHLVVERRSLMRSSREAFERALEEAQLGIGLAGVLADDVDRRRRGVLVESRARIVWEDLELLLEDEQRIRRARLEEAEERQPAPVDAVDVSDLRSVRQQVRIRLEAVDALRGGARDVAVQELTRLLLRAHGAHPGEEEIARLLARFLLDPTGSPARARALADEMLARPDADRAHWARVRREASALLGPDALAAQLRADSLVPPRLAARAAADLARLRAAGVDFAHAEGVWIAASSIAERAERARMRPIAEADLPVVAVPESLVWLLEESAARDGEPSEAYLLVRAAPAASLPEWDPLGPSLLEMHDAAGRALLVGAAMADDQGRLHGLGRLLATHVADGSIELIVAVAPAESASRRATRLIRVAGRVQGESLVLDRAAGPAAQIAWENVARYLARPSSLLSSRVFPPPDVVLEAESEQVAERLRDLTMGERDMHCNLDGRRLVCSPPADDASAAFRAVRRVAADRLATEAERLR